MLLEEVNVETDIHTFDTQTPIPPAKHIKSLMESAVKNRYNIENIVKKIQDAAIKAQSTISIEFKSSFADAKIRDLNYLKEIFEKAGYQVRRVQGSDNRDRYDYIEISWK